MQHAGRVRRPGRLALPPARDRARGLGGADGRRQALDPGDRGRPGPAGDAARVDRRGDQGRPPGPAPHHGRGRAATSWSPSASRSPGGRSRPASTRAWPCSAGRRPWPLPRDARRLAELWATRVSASARGTQRGADADGRRRSSAVFLVIAFVFRRLDVSQDDARRSSAASWPTSSSRRPCSSSGAAGAGAAAMPGPTAKRFVAAPPRRGRGGRGARCEVGGARGRGAHRLRRRPGQPGGAGAAGPRTRRRSIW